MKINFFKRLFHRLFRGTYIHKSLRLGKDVFIGKSCTIYYSFIKKDAAIGDGVIVWDYAHVGERTIVNNNAVIGAYSRIGDDCVIGKDVIIGEHVYISRGSIIADGVYIDDSIYVPAGKEVKKSIISRN